MKLERHRGWWLLVGGPVPRGAAAITIGPVVSVRPSHARSARLIRHELEHVRQWRRLGVVRFLWRYVGAYLGGRIRGYSHHVAYLRIPLEVEAQWAAERDPDPGRWLRD
jgi:Domain of unknown function (DUF4157)